MEKLQVLNNGDLLMENVGATVELTHRVETLDAKVTSCSFFSFLFFFCLFEFFSLTVSRFAKWMGNYLFLFTRLIQSLPFETLHDRILWGQ